MMNGDTFNVVPWYCWENKICSCCNSKHPVLKLKIKMLARILLLSLLCKSEFASNSTIASKVGTARNGAYKYLYDESALDACDTVLLLAVGSAMGVKDNDSISTTIVLNSPVITIVSDHNPRFPVKRLSGQFVNFYNEMVQALQRLIPACKDTEDSLFSLGHIVHVVQQQTKLCPIKQAA